MQFLRRIDRRLRHAELRYYPALNRFEPELALRRLRAYKREERQLSRIPMPLLPLTVWVSGVVLCGLWKITGAFPFLLGGVGLALLGYTLFWRARIRRVRAHIETRVADERAGRRELFCLSCGYDLHGCGDRCPECGDPVSAASLP